MNDFINMISPSLRDAVKKHIFRNSTKANQIFNKNEDYFYFLLDDVRTHLVTPEEIVVSQGSPGDTLYLISMGHCSVQVKNFDKEQVMVRLLGQGDHFGEVALIRNCPRTTTVKSTNYSTLSCISSDAFMEF